MITGAHVIIYSTDPEADRAFLRDQLGFPHVDLGGGWLIFELPPSELAVHPSSKDSVHELYLTCEDVEAFVARMAKKNIPCSDVRRESWGLLTVLTLPGGGELGVYQPLHERPGSASA